MSKNILDEIEIITEYKNGIGITGLCEKYHVGKLKIKKILLDNGVELKKKGGTMPKQTICYRRLEG